MRPPVPQLIRMYSRKYGIDPRAALSVARSEGGLGWGNVGDQGTSYGPFQLHVGGALPQGRGAAWANSPAGLEYAIRQMAQAGARGLQGRAAVAAIVRNFERPAAPLAEINRAMGYYQGIPAAGPTQQMPFGGGPGMPTPTVSAGEKAFMRYLNNLMTQNNRLLGLPNMAQIKGPPVKTINPQTLTFNGKKQYANSVAGLVLATAEKQLGIKYKWGGESRAEGGFDCSGLLYWAFRQHGIKIPRTSQQQWRTGKKVAANNLQPGDAVFFRGYTGGKGGPGHVGMYVGHGMMLVAPQTGDVVKIMPMSAHSGYMGARRFV